MENLVEENRQLKERVKTLEELLRRKEGSNSHAYNEIRAMIINKVGEEIELPDTIENWQKRDVRGRAEKQIMRDLKWDLRIRKVTDFRDEHIGPAKEYIDNYVMSDELKRNRWE